MTKRELPRRVHEKHGAYYYVTGTTPRKWVRLSDVGEGLPGLYKALAAYTSAEIDADLMPMLIEAWKKEVGANRGKKTKANDEYQLREIGKRFEKFRAQDIKPPKIAEFLKQFKDRPRSYNAYRAMLRELMRFAEEMGYRDPGTNPVQAIRTMTIKARDRYITDSELRRIKVGAIYPTWRGGQRPADPDERRKQRNRSGRMITCLIDLAYLTGQRISDLLGLEWSEVGEGGILFEPGKLQHSTGAKIMIEWTPRLRAVILRLKEMRMERPGKSAWVFCTLDGRRYTYSGASTLWKRALKRSGVSGCTFHDLRAKAITDKDEAEGIGAARRMGAHSTEAQTADYVRHKKALKTGATR